MTDISTADWTEVDGSNTTTPPDGWPAGMLGSQVEPAARAIRGAVKRWYDHANATVTSGGTANVKTLTYSVAPAAYVTGDAYVFIVGTTNTGSATLNVNALGAKTIKIGTLSLSGDELTAGTIALVAYDGTNFQLLSAQTRQLLSCSSLGVSMVAGSTNYIGMGSASGENAVWHLPPFAGLASKLRIDVGTAPGVGQTVVATVMIAGVASAITATISGASTTASDSTNAAAVAADQSITIRLVYSAGAASSSASGRVQLGNP